MARCARGQSVEEPAAKPPAQRQSGAIEENDHRLAVRVGLKTRDALEIDDRLPMDAKKVALFELGSDLGHGPSQKVRLGPNT